MRKYGVFVACGCSLLACGPAGNTDVEDTIEDSEAATIAQELYGDTSECINLDPNQANRQLGFRYDIGTNFNSIESSLSGRKPGCDAYVTDYMNADYDEGGTGPNVFIATIQKDMPGDEELCEGIWRSEKVVGYQFEPWEDFALLFHDIDTFASWSGSSCGYAGAFTRVPWFPDGDIVWLDPDGNIHSWVSTYARIRVVAQPFWIYWPMLAKTYVYPSHW